MSAPIKVLIVDDSAVVRTTLRALLAKDPGFESDAAADPILAMARMERDWPDVIVLDIEMPRMDGLTFLKKIMKERPTPVVIVFALAAAGAQPTLEALANGTVDIVMKPQIKVREFLDEGSQQILDVIRAAAGARVRPVTPASGVAPSRPAPLRPAVRLTEVEADTRIVAIGASTGGTVALEKVLVDMPADAPAILVVQHMPELFTKSFADRLNFVSAMEVREAQDKDLVERGHVFIAPGNRHMTLKRAGQNYRIMITDGPPVNRHRPSVDTLFHSVADACGDSAMGIIMTGMGGDGAEGLLAMRRAGAITIAQDEESCVVYGMPQKAVTLNAAAKILPLRKIASEIIHSGRPFEGPRNE